MTDGMVQQLKKVGSRFAFEFFLEVWQPRLVEMLRSWLSSVTLEELHKMVKRGRFPDTGGLNFDVVQPYLEYLEKISTERLFEDFIAPARPDLAEAIQEMGMPGARWLVKLRQHLLDQVRGSVRPIEKMAEVVCDACGKSWVVPVKEFDKITECPFCHTGKDETSVPETPAEQESEKPRAVIDIESELGQ